MCGTALLQQGLRRRNAGVIFHYPVTLGTLMLWSSHICNWYRCCFYRRMHAFLKHPDCETKENLHSLTHKSNPSKMWGEEIMKCINQRCDDSFIYPEQINLFQYFRCFRLCFSIGLCIFWNWIYRRLHCNSIPQSELRWETRNRIITIIEVFYEIK